MCEENFNVTFDVILICIISNLFFFCQIMQK